MKRKYLVQALLVCLIAASCTNSNKTKISSEIDTEVDYAGDFSKAKQIFYALPSPVETAYLIQNTGVPYNIDLANPVSNADNYSTTMQKALNFGVYGADLSYASLFNQTQTSIQYMATTKKLADELGILDFVKEDIVSRIEGNINNRDSLMEIITDGFVGASDNLKETDRAEVAALVVAGGWIEGLYLATSLTDITANNSKLIDLVIDQRLSLSILIRLMNNYKKDSGIAKVCGWLDELQSAYDHVKIVSGENQLETEDGKTTISSNSDYFINDVIFKAICQKTDSIRSIIVK